MTEVNNYLNEIICLQLKKPRSWNWEISTSKSSPHIALPTIQLYNSKGKLLANSKLPHNVSEMRPYHRRSRSADLFQKTGEKYNLPESIKRAENDGYMNFISVERNHQIGPSMNRQKEKNNINVERSSKKASLLICRTATESDLCNNVSNSIEVQNFVKPKRYRLRQSRAGTLLISDEIFSTTHRRRCHEDFGDCRSSNDLMIGDNSISSLEELQFKNKGNIRSFKRTKSEDCKGANLFSKSELVPHGRIRQTRSDTFNGIHSYIANEPLTTTSSNINRNLCESIKICNNVSDSRIANVRRKYSDASTSSISKEFRKGPLNRNHNKSKGGESLVPRLLSSKEGIFQSSFNKLKQKKTVSGKVSESENIEKQIEIGCHVSSVMGANVSRHSTKGLSGRRSQSSGSICNGKGRHQGDGSGKGSGGSLPGYLDDRGSTSTNNYDDHDDKKVPLEEGERIPPIGDGAPLHWKFSDTQTAQCQDQGYGSERSPEEEYPPPLSEHDLDQCHHHLEAHSCYPFITPESTFSVKLCKGSRGLGLSVTGGIETGGSWPGLVRIKRLFPHQPASVCGLLNVGDLLLEANGVPLTGLTNYEALEVLRTAAIQVELRVSRPPPDVLNCVSPISEVPPPPPTRRDPRLNLTSSFYGSTPEDEYYHGEFEVTLSKMQGSLGFTLRKEDDSALGHYVRALVRDPALTDGRIRAGDKIIAVNDVEIFQMTHEQAVQYLRQCGDKVKLRLYRDSPQTPVATLSPTETTPRASFSKKANLRQEAVDMLNDIAVRKLMPCNQQVVRSLSHPSSPRRLRRQNYPSDVSKESGTRYLIPEEQFHEGMLKCEHFDEEAFHSLFTIESDYMNRPSRPNSLDLYNPNQTPVAARKPRFNFSLAHNAYELNNLDPEVLDAPNLTYNLGSEERGNIEPEGGDNFPIEPASMPHFPLDNSSMAFSYKNPAYQSAHPCVESDGRNSFSASKSNVHTHQEEETDTIKRKKGILRKDSTKHLDNIETETEIAKMIPMKEEFEILTIELNRGWNSRLGFSLQGAAGVSYVSAVYADSVAARDGRIKPGDHIIKVNDEEVEHLSTNEIIELLRIVRGPVCIFVKRIKSKEACPKSNAEN